jgi:Uroporphyrinogen decarboxylase (URO-D)
MPMVPPKTWQPPDKQDVYPNVISTFMKLGLWRWKPTNWKPPKSWRNIPRKAYDPFGCVWEYAENDVTKGHPGGDQPMKSYDELDSWKFPDPYDPSQYKFFGRAGKLFPRKYKVALIDSLLFARVQYLRGFTQSLIDFARHPKEITRLINKLKDYFIGTIEMWHKWGAQAVFGQDDMGAQNELFMSPRMYKKFLAPAYKEIATRAHELDMKFILHSCGHVNKLLPIWIDCGIDAVEFDAPRMTGIDFLSEYAGKICFHLVPDIQKVYPFATQGELEQEIKIMIEKIGAKGGLVIRDYPNAVKVLEVPPANNKALPHLVKKWGSYPLSWVN